MIRVWHVEIADSQANHPRSPLTSCVSFGAAASELRTWPRLAQETVVFNALRATYVKRNEITFEDRNAPSMVLLAYAWEWLGFDDMHPTMPVRQLMRGPLAMRAAEDVRAAITHARNSLPPSEPWRQAFSAFAIAADGSHTVLNWATREESFLETRVA